MNTKDRIKQARAENKALRARHRREHEQSRKKWERACMPLIEKASNVEEIKTACRLTPSSSEARKKALLKWADMCTTVSELDAIFDRKLNSTQFHDDDALEEHFFKRWMSLCSSLKDLETQWFVDYLLGRWGSDIAVARKAILEARREELSAQAKAS